MKFCVGRFVWVCLRVCVCESIELSRHSMAFWSQMRIVRWHVTFRSISGQIQWQFVLCYPFYRMVFLCHWTHLCYVKSSIDISLSLFQCSQSLRCFCFVRFVGVFVSVGKNQAPQTPPHKIINKIQFENINKYTATNQLEKRLIKPLAERHTPKSNMFFPASNYKTTSTTTTTWTSPKTDNAIFMKLFYSNR